MRQPCFCMLVLPINCFAFWWDILSNKALYSLQDAGVSSVRNKSFIKTKQEFHQQKIKVPLGENKSSTRRKQKFHQHDTVELSARYRKILRSIPADRLLDWDWSSAQCRKIVVLSWFIRILFVYLATPYVFIRMGYISQNFSLIVINYRDYEGCLS